MFDREREKEMNVIQHIAFNCRDLKAQEQFYVKHFGFHRCRTFNAGTPDEFLMLRLGSVRLELFSARDDAKHVMAKEQEVGFVHLALEVADLDAVIAGLKADGIKTEEIIDCSAITEGFRICFFYDPDGNRLELMQGYKDES